MSVRIPREFNLNWESIDKFRGRKGRRKHKGKWHQGRAEGKGGGSERQDGTGGECEAKELGEKFK